MNDLSAFQDYLNIEIRDPDKLIGEVQKRFAAKLNPFGNNEPNQEKINLSEYINVGIGESLKKILLWGGLALLIYNLTKDK